MVGGLQPDLPCTKPQGGPSCDEAGDTTRDGLGNVIHVINPHGITSGQKPKVCAKGLLQPLQCPTVPYSPFQGPSVWQFVSCLRSHFRTAGMLHMAAKFPEQAGPGPPGHATVCWCTVVIASIMLRSLFQIVLDPFSFTFNLWIVKC